MARCMKCGGSYKKAGKGMNIAKVGQYMGDGGLVGLISIGIILYLIQRA